MIWYILGFIALLRLYRGIRVFLITRRKKDYPLIKGAEPFFHKRGKTGVLLIHGFTSSPDEVRSVGDYLARKNYTVSAPLLKGHGTNPRNLLKIRPEQWQKQIIKEMNKLKKICSRVFILGSSFGGNLAFDYASKHRTAGIVTVGAPILWRKSTLRKVPYYIAKNVKIFQKKKYDYTKVREEIIKKKIQYLNIPLITLGRVLKFTKKSKKELNNIACPVLIMQSKLDAVVSRDTPEYIFNSIRSKIKKIVWFDKAYHVIIIDDTVRKKAFKEVTDFFIHTSKRR